MKKNICFYLFIGFFVSLSQAQSWETLNNPDFVGHHVISFSIGGLGYAITGSGPQGSTKDVFEYNPTTDKWKDLGDYSGPERSFGIGKSWNGKGYFGFGRSNTSDLNDLWEFDPTNNSFTELPACPGVARRHPAFVILNGKIYVGMGSSSSGDLSDWWEYNIDTQIWTQKKNILQNRHHPYQFVIDDFIYVGSGHRDSWYKYDTSNDTWTAITSLDDRVAGTQFNYNGKGYALSGVNNGHNFYETGEFYEYDPLQNDWTDLAPHPGNSLWAPGSFIIDNYIYVFTGTSGQTGSGLGSSAYSSRMYRYDLDAISTSVTSFSNDNEFKLYPNPFSSNIKFDLKTTESGKVLVEIYDALGGKVYENMIFKNEVNLSFLQQGIYTIRILLDNGIQYHERIIKQ